MSLSVAYAQQKEKPVVAQGIYGQLDTEQKAAFRKVQEKYRQQMQELLQQPDNPLVRREKVNQLRTSRDSSLKVALGEQMYQQYRKQVPASPQRNQQAKPGEVQPLIESQEPSEVKRQNGPFVPQAK